MKSRLLAIVASAALAGPISAQAALVTYDFTVNGGASGPLAGVTSAGYFTFDDSVFPGTAGILEQTGLLLDFAFSWNGTAYDETTADSGYIEFDSTGALTFAAFGSDCVPGSCGTSIWDPYSWYVAAAPTLLGAFVYDVGNGVSIYSGTVTSLLRREAAVPEPGTLALLGLGLAGLGLARRRGAT